VGEVMAMVVEFAADAEPATIAPASGGTSRSTPATAARKFTELYNVQRLTSNTIDAASRMVITTIQRLFSTSGVRIVPNIVSLGTGKVIEVEDITVDVLVRGEPFE
jgi:hypothetical protein